MLYSLPLRFKYHTRRRFSCFCCCDVVVVVLVDFDREIVHLDAVILIFFPLVCNRDIVISCFLLLPMSLPLLYNQNARSCNFLPRRMEEDRSRVTVALHRSVPSGSEGKHKRICREVAKACSGNC